MKEGKILKLKIKGTGLSVEEAADAVNLSRGTLYNYFDKELLEDEIKNLFESRFGFKIERIEQIEQIVQSKVQEESLGYLEKRRKQKNTNLEFRVPLVTSKVRAGYVNSYDSVDLINSLDKYAIPPGVSYTGAIWRYFEVDGDSMEPDMVAGDYVLCSQVPREDWDNIRNFYVYVLVTDTQLLIKRIGIKPNTGEWVLISDNEAAAPQKIFDINTLKELWVFRRLIKKSIPPKKRFELKV